MRIAWPKLSSSMFMWNVSSMTLTLGLPTSRTNVILFGRRVQNVVLEPIEHLQAEVDAEVGGEIRETRNAFQAARPVSRLVDRLRIVDRPVGVESPADDVDVEFGEVGQRLFEKSPPRLSDRRVGGRQVSRDGPKPAVIVIPLSRAERPTSAICAGL